MLRPSSAVLAAPQDTGEQGGARGAPERHKRVLVVDDSPETRELERQLLSEGGYDVEVAVDGVDGWNALRTGTFDLLLADIDMPLVDGIKLTRLIRKDPSLEKLPVLIVCEDDDNTQLWRCFDAGADYYVIKARVEHTLVKAVSKLIGPAQ